MSCIVILNGPDLTATLHVFKANFNRVKFTSEITIQIHLHIVAILAGAPVIIHFAWSRFPNKGEYILKVMLPALVAVVQYTPVNPS